MVALNQNPIVDRGNSSTEKVLQTIIKNVHLLFALDIERPRWFCPRELLLAQGFAVFSHLPGYNFTSFSVPRATRLLPQRRRAALMQQAGNTQNVNNAGVCWLYALLNSGSRHEEKASSFLHQLALRSQRAGALSRASALD